MLMIVVAILIALGVLCFWADAFGKPKPLGIQSWTPVAWAFIVAGFALGMFCPYGK